MNTYLPSIWHRLMRKPDAGDAALPCLTLAQWKAMIAHDLEALLNTRVALQHGLLDNYPACLGSIVNYGLTDFAQLCLTSSVDRKEICDRLTRAIERHEPRLAEVRALLIEEAGMVNRLSFVITGTIRAYAGSGAGEVDFNVMLEPSSLRYSIR